MSPSPLCATCRTVNVYSLNQTLNPRPEWWYDRAGRSALRGMTHLTTASLLSASAKDCQLCAMIRNAALTAHKSASLAFATDQPVYLQPKRNRTRCMFPQTEIDDPLCIVGFSAHIPLVDGEVVTGIVRLYAEKGSIAHVSGDVSGRPKLTAANTEGSFDLINHWLDACLRSHSYCKETFSGELLAESDPGYGTILPLRVIDIGDDDAAIRLVQTDQRRGVYAALSHCWGPIEKHPPMTTRANLSSHVRRIEWNKLPKTFQHAITVLRYTSIRYLWIDSLCICQDDHQDWRLHSKSMGRIYERACFTIAASHSPDSTHGLFLSRTAPTSSIELSHVASSGERSGRIFATPMHTDYASMSPEFGILNSRAWASQEWLLSRRMVFFTSESIVWSCKNYTQRETGENFHDPTRNTRWQYIVEKYTARQMTNPTDRLAALDGLRTEYEQKTDDEYIFGLWRYNPGIQQLLWYGLQKLDRANSPLVAPSFSWASTMQAVWFANVSGAHARCEFVGREEPMTLILLARLVRDVALRSLILPTAATELSQDDRLLLHSFHNNVIEEVDRRKVRTIVSADGKTIGWAVLDELELSYGTPIHCAIVMQSVDTVPKAQRIRGLHRDWVLLMQKANEENKYFERVGIGKLNRIVNASKALLRQERQYFNLR